MKSVVGTAGWSLPANQKPMFPSEGTHLQRYAQVFNGVEINSSFYRDHQATTYAKWAASTPDDFLFSVKLSRHFTIDTRLRETERLEGVLGAVSALGKKWGVLLVQLPPSLTFEAGTASKFFGEVRKHYRGALALEPRHPSWASSPALNLIESYDITKVEADPEPCPGGANPRSSWRYVRWHGSPEIYKSRYSEVQIQQLANDLRLMEKPAWIIFDNTTFGYALENASELKALLQDTSLSRVSAPKKNPALGRAFKTLFF